MSGVVPSTPASPCLTHGCAKCCYDTEMLLSNEDIARLVAKGHVAADFSEQDADGFVTLKNVEAVAPRTGKHCHFLKEDRCSVYADRPAGCRSYPIILSADLRAVRDVDCPHRTEFSVPPAAQRKLVKLLSQLTHEAKRR